MFNLIVIELKILLRRKQDIMSPLAFFLMVTALFPLAVTPDPERLREIAAGIIWVGALLSIIVSLERLFKIEFDEGSLEQWEFSNQSLALICGVKICCFWIITCVPLVLLSPILALMLYIPTDALVPLMLGLVIGTPTFCFIGAFGAALTVSLRRGGILIAVLILPLTMPVLIFGASGLSAAVSGAEYIGQMLWLGALLMLSMTLVPFATAEAVKISIGSD